MDNCVNSGTKPEVDGHITCTPPAIVLTEDLPHPVRASKKRPAPLTRALKIFLVFLAVYLATWGGHYTSGDGASKIAWAKVLLFGASAGVVPGPTGIYSKYGIGHSLIAMPALAASAIIRRETGLGTEALLYTLIFVVNGAVLLALIGYYLFHFYPPVRVWTAVALIGLATTWWPYTKVDFSEVFVTTILFAGFVLTRFGRPTAGMLIAALSLTIRIDSIFALALLAAWSLYREPRLRGAIHLFAATLPSLILVAAANYVRYHSVFDKGYDGEGFTGPLIIGLQGILLSPGKSVFLFSPPLILGFFGWRRFFKRPELQSDAVLFAGIFVGELLLYSKWWDWSSDDAWGVRFLIPGVMLMCIPAVEILERRWLTGVVAAAGVWVQLIAVLPGSLAYVLLLRTTHLEREALFVNGRERVDIEDMRFDPNYSQIAGNWILMRHLLHVPPKPSPSGTFAKTGTPLYDTLPPRVWQETAQWDFIWTRFRSFGPSKAVLRTSNGQDATPAAQSQRP
jgi:hypothetical protein